MLLESRLDEETTLFVDVEPAAGFAKDDGDYDFHPDQILDNVVKVSSIVARRLADSANAMISEGKAPPSSLRLEFAIRVDGNSVVSLAPRPEWGHFRVTAEWRPRD